MDIFCFVPSALIALGASTSVDTCSVIHDLAINVWSWFWSWTRTK